MVDPVGIASDLVRIPSENDMGEKTESSEKKLTAFLEGLFENNNIRHLSQEVSPNRRNVLAFVSTPGSRMTILFDAHQDTVPAGKMTVSPFGGEVRGGKLWGRGACDTKGGMAAMIAALCRAATEKPRNAASVILACTVDEEHAFSGVKRLIDGPWPERIPDCAVAAEPTGLKVVTAHKGLAQWRIFTRGKSCHSANPELGDNAIYRMAPVIAALERHAGALRRGIPHPLLGCPSLSVGIVRGGAGINIVPAACELQIDRRLIPGETPLGAFEDCRRELLETLGGDYPLGFEEPWLRAPPLDTSPDSEVSRIALGAVSAVLGHAEPIAVPFGTDAATISAGGIPSVVLGPGDIAQAHTEDEWIDVSEIEQAAEIYFRIILAAGEA